MKKYTTQEDLIQESANAAKKHKLFDQISEDMGLLGGIMGKMEKEAVTKVVDRISENLQKLKSYL